MTFILIHATNASIGSLLTWLHMEVMFGLVCFVDVALC
jgi:hypothetical protein